MTQRRFPWVWVLGLSGVVGLAVLIGGYLYAMRSVVQAYYLGEYQPTALTAADLGQPPAVHRLTDVPWFSEATPVDQSVSLRMLAAQQGHLVPRSTVDFLMGFTWGAMPVPGHIAFFPGQDPESGFLRAAPQLGLTRRYLTTDEGDDFVRALRTFLSKGRAVRVMVDRAMLLEQTGLEPRSLVLVGYDATGFEYYEPTCDDPKRCEPGERAPGTAGLTVKIERLRLAVETLALANQYPWKYQLVVLEPATQVPALEATLARNARALIGAKTAGPPSGAFAVRSVADALEKHGDGVLSPQLVRGARVASQVRLDDAAALVDLFPGHGELAKAAAWLEQAAAHYATAAKALDAKDLTLAQQALRQAASADTEAGQALVLSASDGG